MRSWRKSYDLALLAVYVAVLAGIAIWIVRVRQSMIAQLDQPAQIEDWQEWRAAAAKQDGAHGPVAREVPRSNEPPMLLMMRDNFPAIFFAATVFPAIILGFFLLVLRGVLRQSGAPPNSVTARQHEEPRSHPRVD
jgi:hypothetical protein